MADDCAEQARVVTASNGPVERSHSFCSRLQRVGQHAILFGVLTLVSISISISAVAQSAQERLTAYQYFVQVGAFSTANNATELVEQLQGKNVSRVIIEEARDPGDRLARVLVGPFETHEDALRASQQLLNMNYQPLNGFSQSSCCAN